MAGKISCLEICESVKSAIIRIMLGIWLFPHPIKLQFVLKAKYWSNLQNMHFNHFHYNSFSRRLRLGKIIGRRPYISLNLFCVCTKKVKPRLLLIVFTCCHGQCSFLQVFMWPGVRYDCVVVLITNNSLYTVIGCEINTVLMLVNEIVTLCKHEMVMAVSAKMLVV